MAFDDFLDDPRKAMFLALGAGLLGNAGKGNFGADLSHGLLAGFQGYDAAQQRALQKQKLQREERASELRDLTSVYGLLSPQEQIAAQEAQLTGAPYQRNPMLRQIEGRLTSLMGVPSADAERPDTTQGGRPWARGEAVNPVQTPSGPDTAQSPMPSLRGGMEQPQQPGMPPPMGQQRQQGPSLQQLLQAANIPQEVALGLIRQGKGAELHKLIAEALRPHSGPGGVSRINPQTGEIEMMGGSASPGQVPWAMRSGVPTAMPIQGAAEEVARAERLKAEAVERAKAPFNFGSYNTGPGGAPQVMSVQELMRREQGAQPQGPQSPRPSDLGIVQIPPQVQAERDAKRMQILLAEREALAREGRTDPALEQEIGFAQRGVNFAGQQQQGRGLTGPNPLEVKATEGFNKDFIENTYRPVMDAARSADNILARVTALQRNQILEKTGWGTTQKAYAANLLGAFGVKDAQSFAGDSQTFQKFVMDANWELLNQAKGPQTNQDAERALKTFVQLGNTPKANRFVLDYSAAAAKLAKEKASFFTTEAQKRRGDLLGTEQAWYEQNRSIWDMPEMQRWADGSASLNPNQAQLPGGKTVTFPSEQAAQAFRKALERRR